MDSNNTAWAPYRPTAADPWDLRKVAHLHRRAGFGATWAELQRDLKDGPEASVDRLLAPPRPTADETELLAGVRQGVLAAHGNRPVPRDARLQVWWLYQILNSPDPLREKLTLFWHGHFATSIRKVQHVAWMLRQNETFRRQALSGFAEMLAAVVADPAMLVWLDGGKSHKERPNENFAREFLELFTLGVGHYTEADVKEAARAFTGWRLLPESEYPPGTVVYLYQEAPFDPARFDAGAKTFLGRTGEWQAADVVRVTLEQPAAAEWLCRKLYRYFVSERGEPPADLVQPLAHELRSHDYSVAHVIGVILRSRHLYDPAVFRQRLKGPVEFSAGLVRSLEVPRPDMNLFALAGACERQGQELFAPPTVKGWDGGRSWLNTTTAIERGNWANDLIWGAPDRGLPPYDPLPWGRRQDIPTKEIPDALAKLLLQEEPVPKVRDLVARAAADGTPDGLRKTLQLLVHCPEYQLA
jgi:uncharacterized protein (DUF1800 family)